MSGLLIDITNSLACQSDGTAHILFGYGQSSNQLRSGSGGPQLVPASSLPRFQILPKVKIIHLTAHNCLNSSRESTRMNTNRILNLVRQRAYHYLSASQESLVVCRGFQFTFSPFRPPACIFCASTFQLEPVLRPTSTHISLKLATLCVWMSVPSGPLVVPGSACPTLHPTMSAPSWWFLFSSSCLLAFFCLFLSL